MLVRVSDKRKEVSNEFQWVTRHKSYQINLVVFLTLRVLLSENLVTQRQQWAQR